MKGPLFMLALLLGSAVTACAQLGEVSLNIGDSMLRNNTLGQTSNLAGTGLVDLKDETNFHLALRMTLNKGKFFGHEFGYAYNHGKLTDLGQDISLPMHQGFYDFLVYATPEGSRIRPFAAGGVHFSSFYPPGSSPFSGNGVTKFGINYGGGVKVRMSEMFMVRLDARDYVTGKPNLGQTNIHGMLHQLVVSAGLAFVF